MTAPDGGPAATTATGPAPTATPHQLGRGSRRTLAALAEVVLPDQPDAPRVDTATVVDFIDDWVRYLPRLFRLLFPVGLFLLEWGALVLAPSPVPFSRLSLARRRRYVGARWVHGRSRIRRDLIKAVKGLVLLCYYSERRVMDRIGYTIDEHVAHVSAERLRRHADV